MRLVCYFEEIHQDGLLRDHGFLVYDSIKKDIYEYLSFINDFNTHKLDVPSFDKSNCIFRDEKYFTWEDPNPAYEEDDDGNPIDEDIDPIIEKHSAIFIYGLIQNTLHLLNLKPIVFFRLHKVCSRHSLVSQAESIKSLADKYVNDESSGISYREELYNRIAEATHASLDRVQATPQQMSVIPVPLMTISEADTPERREES